MLQLSSFQASFSRDRAVVAAGLVSVAALAWAYLLYLSQDMGAMVIPLSRSWELSDFWFQFTMWAVMMTAMMLPSAAPMVLSFAAVQRGRRTRQHPPVLTWIFVGGYLAVWIGFAATATLAQWSLHSLALLSPMMKSTSAVLGGGLLVLAAAYQVTPLKRTSLTNCRSPMAFLLMQWRDGLGGALCMGARHGFFCLGCCWALMGVLFVAGVMNLAWVAVLAVLVLAEKALPAGKTVSYLSAPVLVALAGLTVSGGL